MALNMRNLSSQKAPVASRMGRKAMVCNAAAAPVSLEGIVWGLSSPLALALFSGVMGS